MDRPTKAWLAAEEAPSRAAKGACLLRDDLDEKRVASPRNVPGKRMSASSQMLP